MRVLGLLCLLAGAPALGDTVIAARTVPAMAVLTPADIAVDPGAPRGPFRDPAEVLGMEARVVLYPGQAIGPDHLGPPALVQRNQIVVLRFRRGGLTIVAEGRALGRAGAGERLRVMNLASRSIVSGTVHPDGTVAVGGPDPDAGG